MTSNEARERAVEALVQIAQLARAGSEVDPLLSREKTLRAILDDIAVYASRVANETGGNGNG